MDKCAHRPFHVSFRPLMVKILIFILFVCQYVQVCCKYQANSFLFNYLHQEHIHLSEIQSKLVSFLQSNQIPISSEISLVHKSEDIPVQDRITISSKQNPVECRITLTKVKSGKLCVAPCKCTGSQKWVQFSVLNQLRRKDPKQWMVCQTCRSSYSYNLFAVYGGGKGSIIGFMLDRLSVIRSILLIWLGAVWYQLSMSSWISRILVSKTFWQLVSQLTNNPPFYFFKYFTSLSVPSLFIKNC